MKKEIPNYSSFWSSKLVLVLFKVGCFLTGIGSFYLLWNQYLIYGFVAYHLLLVFKMGFCTECANASRNAPNNELWDSIINYCGIIKK